MEGILMMVVLFIISSLFNSKKGKEQKPMPPFNNQPSQPTFEEKQQTERKSAPRTLEDFANEVFQQLNEKTQGPSVNKPVEKVKEVLVEQKPSMDLEKEREKTYSRPEFDANRSTNRQRSEALNTKLAQIDKIKEKEIGHIVPATKDALVQAIITSEIIGPPKAKRR